MKERINWIDWAKAMAVCTVVFCHLPQSQEWFYYRFLQATIITVFFWVSGYLKGIHEDKSRDTFFNFQFSKYWHGLVLPYLLYNAIVYPYWLLRYYMLNGGMPDLFHAMRPIVGTLLLEHENAFAEPLNGPLWYLPAILIMHIILDLCRKTKHMHGLMISICILSFFLYGLNNKYLFMPQLTPIGVLRGIPFYYLGYVMGGVVSENRPQNHMIRSVIYFLLGILCFHWHLQAFHAGEHWQHIILFYPVNLFFLLAVLNLSKALNTYRSSIVQNLSIGTLVIIGLHFPIISLVNYIISHLSFSQGTICYHWYSALPTTLLITALLYPIIIWSKKHLPWLIGKKRTLQCFFQLS